MIYDHCLNIKICPSGNEDIDQIDPNGFIGGKMDMMKSNDDIVKLRDTDDETHVHV